MSPEQMMGEQPSPLDDIYALGATIYEVMTSKPPFYEGDIARQVRRSEAVTMKERRVALKILGKAIPKNWEEAIAKCLSKERTDRPQNSMVLAEMLGLVEQPSWSTKRLPNKHPLGTRAKQLLGVWTRPFLRTKQARIATLISLVILATAAGAIPGVLYSAKNVNTSVASIPTAVPAAAQTSPANRDFPSDSHSTPSPVSAPEALVADPSTIASDHQALTGIVTTGHLEITTQPAGLHYKIFAGKIGVEKSPDIQPLREGTTPDTLSNLDQGPITVVCSRDGWEDQVNEVQVDAENSMVKATFPSGAYSISSVPPGAQVFLDQKPIGVTPLTGEASPGSHDVTLVLGTKPKQSKSISVTEGNIATVDFKFFTSKGSGKRKAKAPPLSEWDKVQNTLKKVFNIQPKSKTKAH
jgi:hypothetical protein